jgi:CheY-like chemotaxis protein
MSKINTVCIIDDDGLYTMLLKKKLEKLDLCHQVQSFPNGENAIVTIREKLVASDALPDIILLDINMPVMNGWEFMEEFMKLLPDIQKKITVYISSSSIDLEDKMKAASYKAIESYLTKPIENDTLLGIMKYN